jgi:hypothetical protein
MEYIDKTNPDIKKEAYRLLKEFIDGQWQKDASRYINLAYEHYDISKLRPLLLNEQNHLCCYCMRYISDTDTKIEHIIPNKATDPAIFDKYKLFGDINDKVFLWQDDMSSTQIIQMPPFPHILAYENLVASCDGSMPEQSSAKCCNIKRGSNEIIPVFYITNAKNEFDYDVNGIIICDSKYYKTIEVLGLEKDTLQRFRRCWLNLPSQYDASDVNDACIDEDLRHKIIDDMDYSRISTSDRGTIFNPTYWNAFAKYFWFYEYKQAKGL